MKTFNLIVLKLKSFTAIEISVAVFLLALILISTILKKIKKYRQDNSLIKNDYGYSDKNGVQRIKYIRIFNYILFAKYNFKKTLINFQEEQDILEDVFETQIANIKRFYLRTILIKLADFKLKLKRKRNEILIGWTGDKYLYLTPKQRTTVIISGEMGSGKSQMILSILNQFQNIYKDHNKITIITSKPEDFENSLSYAENEQDILEELTAYENQRFQSSKNKIQQPPTLIIADEVHNLNKEASLIFTKLLKEGRSQNIIMVMGTQNSNIDTLKNIDTTNVSVKLVMRNTQTEASGKSLFNEAIAKKSFYEEKKHGYGWVKSQGFRLGTLIKLYYEEIKK